MLTKPMLLALIFLVIAALSVCSEAAAQTATIDTFAGNGESTGLDAEGQQALRTSFPYPFDLQFAENGTLLVLGLRSQGIQGDRVVRSISSDGVARVFYRASIPLPQYGLNGISVISDPPILFAAVAGILNTSEIRRIDQLGPRVIGDKSYRFELNILYPTPCLKAARDGTVYFSDSAKHNIVRITPDGRMAIFAGSSQGGYSGDNGLATRAQLRDPTAIALYGNDLYFADTGNNCIRKVSEQGIISTAAGSCGTSGWSGDGGPALNATMSAPLGLAITPDGTLYVADTNNNCIRRVSRDGNIETIAGSGDGPSITECYLGKCFGGDGGPATRARLFSPRSLALDGYRLYVADTHNHRIRRLTFGQPQPAGAPTIRPTRGVVNAASGLEPIAGGSWATVFGTNLAQAPPRVWLADEIIDGVLPTTLEGVNVRIGNRPAAIYFVSPNQVNVQVPDGLPDGEVPVVVATARGTAASSVQHRALAPALFTSASVEPGDISRRYVAAVHLDGVPVGRPSVLQGSRPASLGETILVFGTGYGPSSPPRPAGQVLQPTLLDSTLLVAVISDQRFLVDAAALISPGLYQFNVTLPRSLPRGDHPITIGFLGGLASQISTYLAIE